MVQAIVLIKAESDKVTELAKGLIDVEGVAEVYSVAGRYDLVAIVKVPHMDDFADCISDQMRKQDGILETETLISFRVFSDKDLEVGFGLGL